MTASDLTVKTVAAVAVVTGHVKIRAGSGRGGAESEGGNDLSGWMSGAAFYLMKLLNTSFPLSEVNGISHL